MITSPTQALVREIRLVDAIALVVGSMIGSGIFIVSAESARLQAAWSSLLALTGTYSDLLKYVISVDLLFYVLMIGSVFFLRKRPALTASVRVPGFPYLPILYVVLASTLGGILLVENPKTTWPGYLLALSCVPAYFFWKRKRAPTVA